MNENFNIKIIKSESHLREKLGKSEKPTTIKMGWKNTKKIVMCDFLAIINTFNAL